MAKRTGSPRFSRMCEAGCLASSQRQPALPQGAGR